ncbi:hypothetical protein H0H81_004026 [Sphagnurus paluster]|uniref:P-loop containing nucleoside triphosphate hydrolase protein n=1 Tax=Sphagnurus paluster TaxID=117069 RepID=A0A9P7GF34_9AGAR|nr:hypothetical protein H0H81_004026 [Sphagnurus paluster]
MSTKTRLSVMLSLFSNFLDHAKLTSRETPQGLPRNNAPPQMPRRGGPMVKRGIPNVRKVIAVASGKGGVGKSTVAVNLAFALASLRDPITAARLRVGILDLDIFGPSVPTLMGLENSGEPELTEGGALTPLTNHGLPTMSMGYLLPRSPDSDSTHDTPVVWRGLMVQKAVQQLLFDVDWSMGVRGQGADVGLDALVVDMPPGTGDVPLTLGQLVKVDGAVIVSTPQDVALADVRKGIAMLRKVDVPITGLLLNNAHYFCPTCSPSRPEPHHLFGPPDRFHATAARLGIPVLAELPLVPGVSTAADAGVPYALVQQAKRQAEDGVGGAKWVQGMGEVGMQVWESVNARSG